MAALKYQVITSDSSGGLSAKVAVEIAQGWKPQGGVTVSQTTYPQVDRHDGTTTYDVEQVFAQAMTLEGQ